MTDYDAAVAQLRQEDPDRDYILISNVISRDLHLKLSRAIAQRPPKAAATVFITTNGGDPDGGYRIGRCLRHHYQSVRVTVASWCKSAGTLVAIAANELHIGDFGELGPLDIQVYKGSELQERSSGLDITEAMGAVTQHVRMTFHEMLRETRQLGLSTKLSAEFAAQVSSAIAGPMFSQIDPLRMGELQRMTRIAAEYGKRLDQYSQNLKPGALDSLIHNYPSHSFVIDRKEAATLFHRVAALTPAEAIFVETLWPLVHVQGGFHPEVIDLDPPSDGHDHDEPAQTTGEDAAGAIGAQPEQSQEHSEPGTQSLRVRPSRSRPSPLAAVPDGRDD